ncbi:MAG: F0F1 ATP synthase subunit B [Gammaproteobacteria bacterium RIFCSPHIGHO2_12_FULL_35_23]|nr:MAG: F0F1 ATP synthase subunit B [Gammaproteobacteria bacterium RIFCSPHIGHO2_12_FULL_35_23]
MNINLTLIGQMITFIVFIWFTMRYVWPPITKAMQERQKRISEGLSAAERGKRELELAKHKATEILREAKLNASHLIEQANKRAVQIIEEAKEQARKESQQIIDYAHTEIEQMTANTKDALRKEVADLVVTGAEKVIEKEINKQIHDKVIDELVAEL